MTTDDSFREISWQIVLLILSVITIVFLGIGILSDLDKDISILFLSFDTLICIIFLSDVLHKGVLSKSGRKEYWKWGWIDLLSSIPLLVYLRWGRLYGIFKIILLFRRFKSTKEIFSHLFKDPAAGTLFSVGVASLILLIVGSIGILYFELEAKDSNIISAKDALWWSFVTLTSGAYGDFFPVTGEGKIVAALLTVAGFGLLGTLTAFLAKYWVGGSTRRDSEEIKKSLARIEARIKRGRR